MFDVNHENMDKSWGHSEIRSDSRIEVGKLKDRGQERQGEKTGSRDWEPVCRTADYEQHSGRLRSAGLLKATCYTLPLSLGT